MGPARLGCRLTHRTLQFASEALATESEVALLTPPSTLNPLWGIPSRERRVGLLFYQALKVDAAADYRGRIASGHRELSAEGTEQIAVQVGHVDVDG